MNLTLKRLISTLLLITIVAGVSSILLACDGNVTDLGDFIVDEEDSIVTESITKDVKGGSASDEGYIEVGDIAQDGKAKKIGTLIASPGLNSGWKKYQVTIIQNGLYLLYPKLASGNASKITVQTEVYKDKNFKSKLTPIESTKYKSLYRFVGSSTKYYIKIKISNGDRRTTAKVHWGLRFYQDAVAQNKAGSKTLSTTATINNQTKTLQTTFAESVVWYSTKDKVYNLNKNNYISGKVNLNRDTKVTDLVVYINRLDAQALYGMLTYITRERTSELAKAALNTIKSVYKNDGKQKQYISELSQLIKKHRAHIVATALGTSINVVNQALSLMTEKLNPTDAFISQIVDAISPNKIVSTLLEAFIGEVTNDKLSLSTPKITLTVDSFDYVLTKMKGIYKNELNLMTQQKIINTNSYFTQIMGASPLPVIMFTKGISMTVGTQYYRAGGIWYDYLTIKTWDDSYSKTKYFYGALGQRGKFVKLNTVGGVESVYKMLGTKHRIDFK
ncbi:MAG: hypothetical protein IKA77_03015 [Clostridia bacterium]|nr:hypothetical protein [Clostridia bacterium]